MIQQTSLSTWERVKIDLGCKQLQVYEKIKELKECTNAMLSKELNIPINCVTPRVFELRQGFLVIQSKVDICPITQHKAIFWRLNMY